MKKLILYIGSIVFTALMVYNIGAGNPLVKNPDVSLESIKIMVAGAYNEDPPEEDEFKWIMRKHFYNCSGTVTFIDFTIYSWACENCAWHCNAEKVEKTNPMQSNCSTGYTCGEVYQNEYRQWWHP